MRELKRILLFAFCIIFSFSLVGCKKKQEEKETVVYEFGDEEILYGEYFIYAKTIEEDYRKVYGNGIWGLELETEDGKKTVKEVTIEDIVEDINRIKVLNAQVEDMKISLTTKEKEEIENLTDDFLLGLTEEDIENSEITRNIVERVMKENILAEKVYKRILEDYDFEISEEEARMTSFYDMVFECYEVGKDGEVKEYDKEKKEEQLKKANQALSSLAQDSDMSYEKLIDQYDLKYSANYVMSRTELIDEYGETVASNILSLSDGEISSVIESKYGYHIFKMVEENDKELTKKNKEEIIRKKQKEYFAAIYSDWLKKYDRHFSMEDINMELINQFPFVEES